MDLATIEMDKTQAREKFLEYRRSVRDRHNTEDAQIMRGYRELSKGRQIIDIVATIRAGGTVDVRDRRNFPKNLPRLAIMRADQQWCSVSRRRNGGVTFYKSESSASWGARSPSGRQTRNVVRLPEGTLPNAEQEAYYDFVAMVPPVPPALRPADNIGNYHVLWEADWKAAPPTDPALLKHIGGDLYVVLAIWDLTPLEQSVLAGRVR